MQFVKGRLKQFDKMRAPFKDLVETQQFFSNVTGENY